MHRPRTRHDLGSSSCVFLLTMLHEKLGAPILRPARFAVLETDRPLLAVAEDRDPSLGDALGHEIIHRRLCTSVTEREAFLAPLRGAILLRRDCITSRFRDDTSRGPSVISSSTE